MTKYIWTMDWNAMAWIGILIVLKIMIIHRHRKVGQGDKCPKIVRNSCFSSKVGTGKDAEQTI